jgi:hypothetical protein
MGYTCAFICLLDSLFVNKAAGDELKFVLDLLSNGLGEFVLDNNLLDEL